MTPTPDVVDYVLAHSTPAHPVQELLVARTRQQYPRHATMQIAPEQGPLLTLLTHLVGARQAVEIGTFTGYSSISIARALPPGGRLLCCDISAAATTTAAHAWAEAGLTDRVELRLGPAAETLRALPREERFELAFVDADKAGYATYHDELLPRTRPGGLLVYDNTLLGGRVLDPAASGDAAALRAFNSRLVDDDRVEVVVLPMADGLTLARKR